MQAPYAVHFCIVSDEAAPNLIPAVDTKFRPQKVILLTASGYQDAAHHLTAALKSYGIEPVPYAVPDDLNFAAMHQLVEHCLKKSGGTACALNASAGERLLLLAAYEVFRTHNLPIFHVDTRQDRIRWLSPRELPAQDLQDRIKLPAFLTAYGHHIIRRSEAEPLHNADLTRQLVSGIRDYHGPLRTLNYYAAQAEGKLVSPAIGKDHLHRQEGLAHLIDLFQGCRLLAMDHERLTFPSEAARFYVCGGWFEQYVYGLLAKLRGECAIQDLACNLVVGNGDGVRNELDVAFLSNNQFHAIECKAKRFPLKSSRADRSEAAQTIYKLEALKNLGGAQTRMMLVSYQPIPAHDLLRASERHIAVIDSHEIDHLEARLREWVQAG